MSSITYRTGVSGLDEIVGEISPPYTILISGNPGTGKTTLASTICYTNAIQGKKCLYLTFYEDKEKLFRFMRKLGINLEEAEAKGLLKYLRLPVSLDVEGLVNTIGKLIVEEGFRVLVVDSITVILEAVKEDPGKRGWILNYFYQLPNLMNGLVVLVAELPLQKPMVEHGFLEFTVDAALVLKNKVENGYLSRVLEIRKVRGKALHIAEVPFIISDGKGIKVYVPITPEKIPEHYAEEMVFTCNLLNEKIGHIHRDFLVNIFHPPTAIHGRDTLLVVLALAVKYNLRVLVISYVVAPIQLIDSLARRLEDLGGIPRDVALKTINKYFTIVGINPFAYNVVELAMEELELIDKYKPDLVVFHGVHVSSSRYDPLKYVKELYNQVLYLKSRGILVVRIGSCVDEAYCRSQMSIGDLNLYVMQVTSNGRPELMVYSYRRFKEPRVFTYEELVSSCLKECVEFIKQRLLSSPLSPGAE
ncbi:MAG: ATPase domain-containing protein [Desulfurococcaceae archaeon]